MTWLDLHPSNRNSKEKGEMKEIPPEPKDSFQIHKWK